MDPPIATQIVLDGVRVHNLKGAHVAVPLGRLTVVTGVSGAGKSSLAFDTLHAEAQRRYLQSFSAASRQLLERFDKPDADAIGDLPPAVALRRRPPARNPRATVGTLTEIGDGLRLLFARAGAVHCPRCGTPVRARDTADVIAAAQALPAGTRFAVAFPSRPESADDGEAWAAGLLEEGLVRVQIGPNVHRLDEQTPPLPAAGDRVWVLVDRLEAGHVAPARLTESAETAFARGHGRLGLLADGAETIFDRRLVCSSCDLVLPELEPRWFDPNDPRGACPACDGTGAAAKTGQPCPECGGRRLNRAALAVTLAGRNIAELSALSLDELATFLSPLSPVGRGVGGEGLDFAKAGPSPPTPLPSGERGAECPSPPTPLPGGERGADGPSPPTPLPAGERGAECPSPPTPLPSGERGENPGVDVLLEQLRGRLGWLTAIDLGHLTLDRPAASLSSGPAVRLRLAAALAANLAQALYVIEEPTAGLHPRDTCKLLDELRRLRDAGNTVVVVEHHRAVIAAADHVIDLGPGAGDDGGRVTYQGPPAGLTGEIETPTAEFFAGRRAIAAPARRRTPRGTLRLSGARTHNLRDLTVEFPLGVLCVVTGVGGAGKSSLVAETLYPALGAAKHQKGAPPTEAKVSGAGQVEDVVLMDQQPLPRSSRSNPATYLKIFDEVRAVFAATPEAKIRNFGPGHFSFNQPGGRCETCAGQGTLTVDMQFLADVTVICPECHGSRYRREVLDVKVRGLSIAEVLDLTAREAFRFFRAQPAVERRLRHLLDVGLDYLRLGQPADTLSGGEAQRLKLAGHLAASRKPHGLFLLLEPSAGLHPADVEVLLGCFDRLLDAGHSLVLVENDLDVVRCADHVIDLGPEAGAAGGRIVAAGTPEAVAAVEASHTGRGLRGVLGG